MNYYSHHIGDYLTATAHLTLLEHGAYRRLIDIPLAYKGFELPDTFVVGYGLDAGGHYRNLPFIGLLKDQARGR